MPKLFSATDKPAAPIPPQELVQALIARDHELRDRYNVLISRIVELEKAGVEETPPAQPSEHQELVSSLVNGFGGPTAKMKHPGEELRSCWIEARGIEGAREILQSKQVQARCLAVASVMQQRGDDWISIARDRASAIIALRLANRRAEQFRRDVTRAGGMSPSLVCDRTGGVFANGVSDAGYEYLQECLRRKIITPKEVGDAL